MCRLCFVIINNVLFNPLTFYVKCCFVASKRGLPQKMCRLCFVIINIVLFNLSTFHVFLCELNLSSASFPTSFRFDYHVVLCSLVEQRVP